MIFNSSRTLYNVKLQTCKLLNLEYTPLINTTLNEKFNIYPNYIIPNNPIPDLNLIVFGIGGSHIINNNTLALKRAKHGAIDAALFEHLPLMIKRYNTPLTPYETELYRLKTVEEINNVHYDVYYGMVLSNITYDPRIYKINSGKISFNSSILDTSINTDLLNPVVKVGDLSADNNEYVINTCKIGININTIIMNEIINSIGIKYPGGGVTNFTEIGICSSVDYIIDNKKEALNAQVNYFIDLDLDIQVLQTKLNIDGSVTLSIDIGGMEPLIL